jgi:trimethylamine--corrinoid protein Co-methyltransferase
MTMLRSNYRVNRTTQFRALSDDQVQDIHLAVLEVLERTGIRVHSEEAVAVYKKAGAKVKGDRVWIPSYLVEEAVRRAPSRVTLCNRDGKRTVILEDHKVYYGTGSDCPSIRDSYTGEVRRFTKKDIEQAARISDFLSNIDFHMSLGLMSDVPTETYFRHQYVAMLRNCRKPIVFTSADKACLADIIDIAAANSGGLDELQKNPTLCLYAEPSSPLNHSKNAIEKFLLAAENRVPTIYTPCPIAGATTPMTLAGALVVSVADSLSGLVAAQFHAPGAPFIMGGVLSTMDMATTIYTYGSPELSLLQAALADISHFYHLPMFGTAGCTDSKVFDEQAAAEAMMSIFAAALSGQNLVHDVGFLENGLIGSFELVVASDEYIGMAKHFVKGIEVNTDTLALEVIDKVGPGGNFVSEDHTDRHFREVEWFPKLMDRQNYSNWEGSGSKPMRQRANERVKEILDTHRVEPLRDEAEKTIEKVFKKYGQRA